MRDAESAYVGIFLGLVLSIGVVLALFPASAGASIPGLGRPGGEGVNQTRKTGEALFLAAWLAAGGCAGGGGDLPDGARGLVRGGPPVMSEGDAAAIPLEAGPAVEVSGAADLAVAPAVDATPAVDARDRICPSEMMSGARREPVCEPHQLAAMVKREPRCGMVWYAGSENGQTCYVCGSAAVFSSRCNASQGGAGWCVSRCEDCWACGDRMERDQ